MARGEAATIVLVALPGCMTSALAGSLEAFGIASTLAPSGSVLLSAQVATKDGEPVSGIGGIPIPATTRLDQLDRTDIAIVPPIIGDPTQIVEEHGDVVGWLRDAGQRGTVLTATCTGTFLLAETGDLNGRRATTTPTFSQVFERRYPEVRLLPGLRVVDEGAVLTAGATTSYLDLALALIRRTLGPRVALETGRFLVTDPNPRSQHPYLLPRPAVAHPDEEIRKAERWIAENLASPCDVEVLARFAGLGRRTFHRRFRAATGQSTTQYVRRLRIEAAMKELEATNRSFEEITLACGYEDVRSFRRLFREQTGVSPREYRRRFGFGSTSP